MSFDREKSIFLAALELPAGAQRDAYVAQECGDDADLQASIDELLAAHDRSINVLDQETPQRLALQGKVKSAADAIALTADWGDGSEQEDGQPQIDGSTTIGNYVLMEKLGEGGFGQVYVAQQEKPVKRRVALKLLKAHALSPDAIARFEAERQALAMMDHPNIARIFDGGATASGQPYFVMELVRGVHITKFCRDHDLSVRERLELFLDVCRAVQHAHQKGIIHRDLKPSNVLVTLHDADAVVKVIDFGVAKALNEPLTEKTIYTRFAQMIGTPMYMSPEQAEMNSLDVDTRSDIYSLGVLLYELLTEQTPFDQVRLQTASFDEMRRMIREEDPPRPSARLTADGQLASTSKSRRTSQPRNLASELRGDLDWVVMKALEKDRRRRYETAADMAHDVQRYLEQQPVMARPPSQWYRFTRFANRNKTVFASTVIVLLALIVGTIFSSWQAIKATIAQAETEELRREEAASIEKLKQANVLLDSARANADEDRLQLALEQYTKATQLSPNHYLTWSGRGALLARIGAWRMAAADYRTALELGAPANNPAWWGVPQLCRYADDQVGYDLVCKQLMTQVESNDHGQLAMIIRGLALEDRSPGVMKDLAGRMEEVLLAHDLDEFVPRFGPGRGPRPPNMGDGPPRMRFSDGPPPGGPRGGPGGPGGHGMMREIDTYSAAVANYRAGNAKRAVELLSETKNRDERSMIDSLSAPVMALALHAEGKTEAAKEYLTESQAAIDEWLEQLEVSPDAPNYPWFDFLEIYLWHQEAVWAIEGRLPEENSRLRHAEFEAEELFRESAKQAAISEPS